MGREFRHDNGNMAAHWDLTGRVYAITSIDPQEVPDFIAWLQEGPPKPKWRITREFDEKPCEVWAHNAGNDANSYRAIALTDADVERVT